MSTELEQGRSARHGDAAGIRDCKPIPAHSSSFSARLWRRAEKRSPRLAARPWLQRGRGLRGGIKSVPDGLDGTGGIQGRPLPGTEQEGILNSALTACQVRNRRGVSPGRHHAWPCCVTQAPMRRRMHAGFVFVHGLYGPAPVLFDLTSGAVWRCVLLIPSAISVGYVVSAFSRLFWEAKRSGNRAVSGPASLPCARLGESAFAQCANAVQFAAA